MFCMSWLKCLTWSRALPILFQITSSPAIIHHASETLASTYFHLPRIFLISSSVGSQACTPCVSRDPTHASSISLLVVMFTLSSGSAGLNSVNFAYAFDVCCSVEVAFRSFDISFPNWVYKFCHVLNLITVCAKVFLSLPDLHHWKPFGFFNW